MENEKIEKMLYDAQEKLPITNLEWRVSDMEEKRVEKKKFHVNKTVAACIALVLFLGIGGVTVLANMELDIDPGEYGQWVSGGYDENWDTCKREMKIRGFVLPEMFGEYEFDYYSTLLVVKHGVTYLEALMNPVYNPISLEFDDKQKEDAYSISISVGELEEEYWSAYYEFEKIDDAWVYSDAETTFEYGGMTVYGKQFHFESCEDMSWRWVDEKTGVCWCVYVPINTGMENEMDSMEVVKTIIDLNK